VVILAETTGPPEVPETSAIMDRTVAYRTFQVASDGSVKAYRKAYTTDGSR